MNKYENDNFILFSFNSINVKHTDYSEVPITKT